MPKRVGIIVEMEQQEKVAMQRLVEPIYLLLGVVAEEVGTVEEAVCVITVVEGDLATIFQVLYFSIILGV